MIEQAHVNAAGEARPVDTVERVVLLDVVRGFALAGVLLSNVHAWFSGRAFLPSDRFKAMMAKPVEAAISGAVWFFVSGKFFTIFSFLFGLGFAVQLIRAEGRGESVVPVYARRLVIMVLIGAAHSLAIWYGDILHLYALIGFALLAFRRRSDRTLLVWGFACAVLVPATVSLAHAFLPRLWTPPEAIAAAAEATKAHRIEYKARILEVFSSGSYFDIVRNNPVVYWEQFVNVPLVGFYIGLLGRFLLGFYAGRARLFHDASRHRGLFRRTLIWGLVTGIIASGFNVGLGFLTHSGRIAENNLLRKIAAPWISEIGLMGLAMCYVSAIVLLFQRERWRRVLSLLAPVGQTALSSYLAQSVISIFIFYGIGLGLIGKAGQAACLAIVFAIFTLQIVCSHLWLARFRFGPMEWLWRSLTYGKAQPMRKAAAPMLVA